MIARLRGELAATLADGIVLDVHGVGYRLFATRSAIRLAQAGGTVTLETHLHVREDAMQLFGFGSADERDLFEELQGVSGIGPKVALAIVSAQTPADLRRAIVREDVALFQSIPGIGRKLAQRLVLELKERAAVSLPAAIAADPGADDAPLADPHLVARDALVMLGFTLAEAEQRLGALEPDLPVEERIRLALKAAA
jgi:Holliday junction DNA helicase RuvA